MWYPFHGLYTRSQSDTLLESSNGAGNIGFRTQHTAFVEGVGAVFEARSTRIVEGQLDSGAMILVY